MTQVGEMAEPLRIYLFGHFRVERDGEAIELPTRKSEALCAYLVLQPAVHAREKLAALFWPDVPDKSARASLRNALSTLRRKLGHNLLEADRQQVQLVDTSRLWVDALAFRAQATRYLEAPTPDADAVNLDLYTDDLLAEFYDDWVLAEREALRALYLESVLALVQQLRAQSEYESAVAFAERALACDPANERAHQHLMVCHVTLGNRGASLRQYEACKRALREELAVAPSMATEKLYKWVRQAPPESLPVEAAITNLPIPLTSFVGRQRAVTAVKELLSSARLLTLTGAGGSGKTRLAIRVATDRLDGYGDGVWWVELAPVADADLLPRAVAKALGVPEVPEQTIEKTLVNFLRARELLLVLDNCEHLVAACARLAAQLLGACPRLKVLATSREVLGIAGEHVWPVPALSLPDPEQTVPAGPLQAYDAIRLFAGRARAVRPEFALTEANAPAVAAICRRLDGLPLAIELAAARVNMFSAEQIAGRLDDTFRLLSSGARSAASRHHTLRAALDWSYDLLAEKEQELFRRLAVFAGGWTLAAVETVCSGDGIAQSEIVDLLSRLVDKSLVEVQERGVEMRYRMLETIRQYSGDRLRASGESERVRARHLHYFSRLVVEIDPYLGYFLADSKAEVWLGRIEAEYDNVRAALRWSTGPGDQGADGRIEAGLRLAINLHWYWFARGHFSEGRACLAQLLASNANVSAQAQAEGLLTAGYLACWQGDFTSGAPLLEEALSLFRRGEDAGGVAFALHGTGFVALGQGNLPLSRSRFAGALKVARAEGLDWLTSFILHFLGIVLTYQGEYVGAVRHFEEGDTLLQQLGGYRQGAAFSLFHRGRIARLQGDFARARSFHAEGLARFRESGDRRGIGYSLAGFALLAAAQGEPERAAYLSGAVASVQAVIGPFVEMPLQMEYDQGLVAVRAALDEETRVAAVAEGREISLEEAIAFALAT